MINPTFEKFDIRNFTDRLTPKSGKNRYKCPGCEGTLTIDPSNGKYHCWGEECPTKAIREAIRPLHELLAEAGIEKKGFAPKIYNQKPEAVISPAVIPDGDIHLGMLANAVKQEPRVRVGRNIEVRYPYSSTQFVKRIERPDGSKITLPYHLDSTGNEVNAKGEEFWQPYRFEEITQHGKGQWVLSVEGEKCVDIARSIFSLLAITFQGGSWSDALLVEYFQLLKDIGIAGIVYWTDHDKAGYAKLEKCRLAASKVDLPFIAIDPIRLWADCPKGGDIADWVKADLGNLEKLYQEINLVAEEARGSQPQTETSNSKPIKSDDWKDEYELRRRHRAKIKFTRKADIEVKNGYLPTYNLNTLPTGNIGLIGEWGAGKSHFIANLCKQWPGKILQIAHLNAILHNTAPKYDLMHHHEAKKLNLSLTSVPRLSICDVTFAANFNPEHWAKGELFILILDEISQALESLHTSPNLRGNLRIKARTKLEWLVRNATYILAADRDLDDETLEYIERVRNDGKKSFIIHHTAKKGKSHKPITINNNKHKDEVLTRLINDVKAGLKCAIACENKTDLIAIELLLKNAGIPEESVFLAHGDNSNEPHIKPIIQAIDTQYTEYPVLGYTMTMGSAISLEKQHFDKVYAFFTGDVLAVSNQCQMLFRYRLDCEIIIWISPKRRTLEIDPKNLLKNLQINIDETNTLISSIDAIDTLHKKGIMPTARGVISEDELPFLQHKLSIISRKNASRANPFQSIYDFLIDAGFTINLECTDAEEAVRTQEGEIHTSAKKEVKEEGDRLVAESELMTDIEFESAKINAGSLRKSERDRLQKTQLHRDTGLEISQDIVKLQRTKNLTRGARMLRVLLGDDETAVAYDLVDRERNPDKGDQNFYAAKRRLLKKLGTPELIDKLRNDAWSYTNTSPEMQEFGDRVRQNKADIKRLLGFTVSMERTSKDTFKISNTELLGRTLDSLCVLRNSQKDRVFGRIYSLDINHWEKLEKIMAHMDSQAPTLQGVIEIAEATEVAKKEITTITTQAMPAAESYAEVATIEIVAVTVEESPVLAEINSYELPAIAGEVISQVDKAIVKAEPLLELANLPDVIVWRRRLGRALVLGHEIAREVYQLLPQQILNEIWEGLTAGTQKDYYKIFGMTYG